MAREMRINVTEEEYFLSPIFMGEIIALFGHPIWYEDNLVSIYFMTRVYKRAIFLIGDSNLRVTKEVVKPVINYQLGDKHVLLGALYTRYKM